MGNTLYLECYSGISGDMTVGALLDLGADREVLEKALESLGVGGYHLHFGRKAKSGIDAYDFDVHLEQDEHGHGNGHGHGNDHGHDHSHEHSHEHDHSHEHEHSHNHEHRHSHGHDHSYELEHSHNHMHRNIHDIFQIIDRLDSVQSVKDLAKKIFQIVAQAESKAHGIPMEEVHFHEVGAIDSIVDIISTAICLDNLGVDEVIVSPLAEGRGYVHCQHGTIPVPVPATANIVTSHGLVLKPTDNEGEMVTPTGAAIAAALHSGRDLPKNYKIQKIGIGAGNKDFKNANILRAMLIEPLEDKPSDMWKLESNIDDCSGEMLGFAMDLLLEAGAADVWYSPVYMKKNRPAYTLEVLCKEELTECMEDIILTQTTSIGIRKYPVARTVMERRQERIQTVLGEALVKVCTHKGKSFCYPEYESIVTISRDNGLDFGSVYHQVMEEAVKKFQKS